MRPRPDSFVAPSLALILPLHTLATDPNASSPLSHGAIPDDGADERPAFQRALEAIAAARGNRVRFRKYPSHAPRNPTIHPTAAPPKTSHAEFTR